MGTKQKAAISAAILATLVSALAATTIVGREVRAVELLALFAGGFGSGAAVAVAVIASRSARSGASAPGSGDNAINGESDDA